MKGQAKKVCKLRLLLPQHRSDWIRPDLETSHELFEQFIAALLCRLAEILSTRAHHVFNNLGHQFRSFPHIAGGLVGREHPDRVNAVAGHAVRLRHVVRLSTSEQEGCPGFRPIVEQREYHFAARSDRPHGEQCLIDKHCAGVWVYAFPEFIRHEREDIIEFGKTEERMCRPIVRSFPALTVVEVQDEASGELVGPGDRQEVGIPTLLLSDDGQAIFLEARGQRV